MTSTREEVRDVSIAESELGDHVLETTPSGLRFTDPRAERRYRKWHIGAALFYSRLGLVASLGLWAAVLVGFSLAISGAFIRVVLWCAAALAIVGAGLAVTFVVRWRAWVPAVTVLMNASAGFMAIGLAEALLPEGFDLTVAGMGMVLVLFFAFTVFLLHPLPAALTVATYSITYVAIITAEYLAGEVDAIRYWVTTVLLASAYAGGLFINVQIERQMRQRFRDEKTIERQSRVIDTQRREADDLLLNILPAEIVERLKAGPGVIAQRFEAVTVLFADVVGFTQLSARVAPDRLVEVLNKAFTRFDELASHFGVEKIKTIGDAYMAVAGVPRPRSDHAQVIADLALAMRCESVELDGNTLEFRIGISSGPAVAGVIGIHKFAYDLWGDTVNTAERMESSGISGEIQVSEATHDLLERSHRMRDRGVVDIKGIGPCRTWFLDGRL